MEKRKGGRSPIPYPENWEHVYNQWQSGEFSGQEAFHILKLPRGTFYNMARRYEEENGIVGKRFTGARKNPYKGIERVISVTGKFKDTVLKYNDYIERNILLRIDYEKLKESYNTEDMEYAKGILNLLHQAMVRIYGSDSITELADTKSEILIPGVIAGNGEVCLAMLVVNLTGVLKSIDFLTEYGCILSGEKKRVEEITRKYTPYVYGYTVILPQDNFSIDKLPEKVQLLLTNYKDRKVRLLCDQNDIY